MNKNIQLKPENALKRAEELITIGNKGEALNTLFSIITAKKYRGDWQLVLEKIMLKLLDLCVELRKGKFAKDSLHQYKVSCQTANLQSLELVVKHFLELAEERAKDAQSKAAQTVLDIEDLEDTDESEAALSLSSSVGVVEESTKERTDREMVTPWLKFLWETYRTVLDILRNNNKLEQIYKETTKRAFDFCIKYKRNTEFRRLTEVLRTHLAHISKYSNQAQAVNLNSAESLSLHIESRFEQYETAVKLELWQECFKSVEDIHQLLTMAVKTVPQPKASTIANYYKILANVFWVSEDYLFHAYAVNKYYSLSKTYNKGLKDEEAKSLAASALLATMCIPIEERANPLNEFDLQANKNQRLAILLHFSSVPVVPTRSSLIEELQARGVPNQTFPELKDFLNLMEKKFNPLQFCSQIKPKLDFIASRNLKQYVRPLERIMFVRLMQQLARVYDTMKISELSKLVYFANFFEVEKLVVECIQKKYIDMRIDHQNSALIFKSQSLESSQFRNQLIDLSQKLQTATRMIHPEKFSEASYLEKKQQMYKELLVSMEKEQQAINQRKLLIEKKREEEELKLKEKARKEEEERKAKEEEALRIENEKRKQSEEERLQRLIKQENEEKKKKEMQLLLESKPGLATAVVGEVEVADADEILRKSKEKYEKAQAELASKLKKMERTLDWIERAKHKEEQPLLAKWYTDFQVEDKALYEERKTTLTKQRREKWENDIKEKQRLQKMTSDYRTFADEILRRRKETYDKLSKEREARLSEKKTKREEERRRKQEEEERIQREKEEEETKKRQEDEERARKLQEQDELRRKREEEVLRKRREVEPAPTEAAPAKGGAYVPPGARGPRDSPAEGRKAGAYVPPSAKRSEGASEEPKPYSLSKEREAPREEKPREAYRPPARSEEDRPFRPRDAPRDEDRPYRPRDAPRDAPRDERPREEDRPYRPRDGPREDRPREDRPREEDRPYRPRDAPRDGPRDEKPREAYRPPGAREDRPYRPRDRDAPASSDSANDGFTVVARKR